MTWLKKVYSKSNQQSHFHSIDAKIAAVKLSYNKGKKLVFQLRKEQNSSSAKRLWDFLFQRMTHLLCLLKIFPIRAARVERQFPKMKWIETFVETCVRNQLKTSEIAPPFLHQDWVSLQKTDSMTKFIDTSHTNSK